MELEGTLLLERSPTRRWISIIAIVIPVAAVVMCAAWFVRAFIVPPTITIQGPMVTAAAPPPPVRAEPPVVAQPQPKQVTMAEPAAPPSPPPTVADSAAEPAAAAPAGQQVLATLAMAPPNFNNLNGSPPAAFVDPASPPAAADAATPSPDTIASIEPSEPIKGPVPLPRHRRQVSAAMITGAVPLPRPKPNTEETTAPDLPAIDRHAVVD